MTTNELWAKFEAWYADAIGDVQPFECYMKGYASRDAEVEALREDAERYRWLRLKCTDELCVRKGVALVTGAALHAAFDDAMREESK